MYSVCFLLLLSCFIPEIYFYINYLFYRFDCFFIRIIHNIVVGKTYHYDIWKEDRFKEIRKLYWNFEFNIINFNEVLIVIKFIFAIYIYIIQWSERGLWRCSNQTTLYSLFLLRCSNRELLMMAISARFSAAQLLKNREILFFSIFFKILSGITTNRTSIHWQRSITERNNW